MRLDSCEVLLLSTTMHFLVLSNASLTLLTGNGIRYRICRKLTVTPSCLRIFMAVALTLARGPDYYFF